MVVVEKGYLSPPTIHPLSLLFATPSHIIFFLLSPFLTSTHPPTPLTHPFTLPPPFSHHVGMSTEDMLKEIAIKVKRNKMKADIRGADQLQDMYQSR